MKHLQANVVHKLNWTIAKKVKQKLATTLGTNLIFKKIIVNVGVSLIPSRHQWACYFKSPHVQGVKHDKTDWLSRYKKIIKIERHLGKKIQYINLGLNHEHLRLIVGIFLKTRWREWMLVHQKGMGYSPSCHFVFSKLASLVAKGGHGCGG